MANRTKRTPQREKDIIAQLLQGRSILAACHAAKIGRSTYYEWRDDSPEFAAACDEAYEGGTDTLEDVALHLAIRGNVPILLATLKARRREKWGDKIVNELTGKDGGPIEITEFEVTRTVQQAAS
jgi:hypothetical protein